MKPFRRTRIALALAVAAAPLTAQTRIPTGVTPLTPGQVQIVATYINANGKVVADTIRITVLPATIATIDLFNTFSPPAWTTNVTIGKPFCAFAQAKDSAGNILTGRPVTFSSTNPGVAQITASTLCPDTTIDASKMTANPLPPTLLSLLNLPPRTRPK